MFTIEPEELIIMKRLVKFLRTTFLGGMIILLPVVVTFLFLRWLFDFAIGLIEPLTRMLMEQSKLQKFFADILVVVLILLVCFFIGLIVKTKFGRYIHRVVEDKILEVAPGYSLFKETIKQFLGKDRAPFSQVALVQVFGDSSRTLMTGLVTDESPDQGYYTVYVPSGLNPTTGLIYHVEAKYVFLVDVPVEDAMRSLISCGGGSTDLIGKLKASAGEDPA